MPRNHQKHQRSAAEGKANHPLFPLPIATRIIAAGETKNPRSITCPTMCSSIGGNQVYIIAPSESVTFAVAAHRPARANTFRHKTSVLLSYFRYRRQASTMSNGGTPSRIAKPSKFKIAFTKLLWVSFRLRPSLRPHHPGMPLIYLCVHARQAPAISGAVLGFEFGAESANDGEGLGGGDEIPLFGLPALCLALLHLLLH